MENHVLIEKWVFIIVNISYGNWLFLREQKRKQNFDHRLIIFFKNAQSEYGNDNDDNSNDNHNNYNQNIIDDYDDDDNNSDDNYKNDNDRDRYIFDCTSYL